MAVLKTLDLNGNKQSFASWISNLSPCDSPFTSMINKEGITQAQYSWQTDALAPADDTTYEEGSQAEFQTRATTEILTNFTSILRKVVSVSETAELVATHGRGSETKYQMAKAGKEIMRDLELMTLHNVNGNPSTRNTASKFAGFEGLVGGLGVHDNDTGAIVHKVGIVAEKMVCIPTEIIFDLTYNLYLAGSKADKIMFHPKHAVAFAGLIGNNPDSASTYRMFDNLDTKFNTFVKKIRDPLGRVYTLIPNRWMPEDKIYFFNEKDWTQTILREPSLKKLGKKGASDQFLMEMEVGLRHRHPFASGILALESKIAHNTFKPTRTAFTASVNDSQAVRCDTSLDGVGEAGHVVTFHTSNPDIMSFESKNVTTPSSGRAANKMIAGNRDGLVDVWTVFKGVKSEVTQITVINPIIELTVDNKDPVAPQKVTFSAQVKKANGGLAGDGIFVKWNVEQPINLELDSLSSETVAGTATVMARALNDDETDVYATLNGIASNVVTLNYIPAPDNLSAPELSQYPVPRGGGTVAKVVLEDSKGSPLMGAEVTWSVNPPGILTSSSGYTTTTDNNGMSTLSLDAGSTRGDVVIVYRCEGVSSDPVTVRVGDGATINFTHTPRNPKVDENVKFTAELTRTADGVPIANAVINLTSDMPTATFPHSMNTNDQGIAEFETSFSANSDFEITADATTFNDRVVEKVEVQLA